MGKMNVRERVWEVIEVARPGDRLSRGVDAFILILIFANVIAVIVGSVPSIYARYGTQLNVFEIFSVAIFSVEYLTRIWACTVDRRFASPVWGRLKFARQPMSIIDLAAILPFFLPFLGFDLRSLRVLRLLRLLRIAKIGRYYSSLTVIKKVVRAKKEELVLTFTLMVMLVIVSSSVIYFCENGENPQTFSSIPATMWWAVETLTTVGYGDMYPTTGLGKLFASLIAILGIGMFALPTGILGAGFVEEIQKSKAEDSVCPHCGERID
jgi:voltage-gated potassium channel